MNFVSSCGGRTLREKKIEKNWFGERDDAAGTRAEICLQIKMGGWAIELGRS